MSKVIKSEKVVGLIKDGDWIFTSAFVGIASAEEIFSEMEASFLETGSPRDLQLCFAAGFGDGKVGKKGLNHFTHKGMVKTMMAGHYGLGPGLADLVATNDIVGYNLPQGVVSQMFRAVAGGRPGVVSHVGLGTFVDPDLQGGVLNQGIEVEPVVEKIKLGGKDLLFFKAPKPNVAILRGTTADEEGNVSMEEEALSLENLSIATAVRNAGGIVIVQVKNLVKPGDIQPKNVTIPGIMVDHIVVCENPEVNHMQNFAEYLNESYISRKVGEVEEGEAKPFPLTERKIIARRSAMLLDKSKRVLNYGIGLPETIAAVLKEEGQESPFIPTVEPGAIGGTPAGGAGFGAASNAHAIIDQPYQFDFYDGGGLDMAFLGLAECDEVGNINVSKFGPKIAGCGGFINITQNAKEVVFCGAFTAGGLKLEVVDGKLKIAQEGRSKKFIKAVEHVTFSGLLAKANKKKVTYVTERAVFELREEGLVLIEIAPGIDLEKDVLGQMDFKPIIAADLKEMDARIFEDKLMKLEF